MSHRPPQTGGMPSDGRAPAQRDARGLRAVISRDLARDLARSRACMSPLRAMCCGQSCEMKTLSFPRSCSNRNTCRGAEPRCRPPGAIRRGDQTRRRAHLELPHVVRRAHVVVGVRRDLVVTHAVVAPVVDARKAADAHTADVDDASASEARAVSGISASQRAPRKISRRTRGNRCLARASRRSRAPTCGCSPHGCRQPQSSERAPPSRPSSTCRTTACYGTLAGTPSSTGRPAVGWRMVRAWLGRRGRRLARSRPRDRSVPLRAGPRSIAGRSGQTRLVAHGLEVAAYDQHIDGQSGLLLRQTDRVVDRIQFSVTAAFDRDLRSARLVWSARARRRRRGRRTSISLSSPRHVAISRARAGGPGGLPRSRFTQRGCSNERS